MKALFTLGSCSLSVSKHRFPGGLHPVLLSLSSTYAITRWWSLPMSASLLTLTSSSEHLQISLINKWSIWFLSLPFGEQQVSLWMSRCGKIVPPMTRLYDVSYYLLPFTLCWGHPSHSVGPDMVPPLFLPVADHRRWLWWCLHSLGHNTGLGSRWLVILSSWLSSVCCWMVSTLTGTWHFSLPFLRMTAPLSWCWSSPLPEYSTVSPAVVLSLNCSHWLPWYVQAITLHFCYDLHQLAHLIHSLHVPETYSGLSLGIQDFHLPVSSFLAAFTTIMHMSLLKRLWKAVTHSCSWFLCCCFCNIIFFYGTGLTFYPPPQTWRAEWIALHLVSPPWPVRHGATKHTSSPTMSCMVVITVNVTLCYRVTHGVQFVMVLQRSEYLQICIIM